MKKRITIMQPVGSSMPPDSTQYTDDTRNPFEPDARFLVPGAYVVVEVWDDKVGRYVEVLNLTIPEVQP